jgi:hypothetical protein
VCLEKSFLSLYNEKGGKMSPRLPKEDAPKQQKKKVWVQIREGKVISVFYENPIHERSLYVNDVFREMDEEDLKKEQGGKKK